MAAAQMSVSPDNSPVSAPPGSSGSLTFTLQTDDPNAAQNTIQVSCDGTVVVSCGSDKSWVMIQSGSPVTITVTYTVGNNAGGTGYIDVSMTDQWTGETVDGSADVTTQSSKPRLSASPTTQYTGENVSTNYPSFTLTNSGDTPATYTASVTCSVASNCSVRAQPPSGLAPGASTTLIVDYQSYIASAGNESITLKVTSQFAETGSSTVTIVPLSENVSVTAGTAPTAPYPSQSGTYPFTVVDVGNNSDPTTYTLATTCTGALSCGAASPTSVTITPGGVANATITAAATSNPAGGTGTVKLTASHTDAWGQTYSNWSSFNVTVPDTRTYTVAVSPTSTTGYNEANVSTNYRFTLTNSGNMQANYTLTLPTCSGTASGCSFSSSSAVTSTTVTVNPNGGTAAVPVYFTTLGAGQNANFTLQAAGPTNTASGTMTVVPLAPTVQVTAGTTPTVSTNTNGSLQFHVHNVGTSGQVTYSLQVSACGAPLVTTSCTAPAAIAVAQGADSVVSVGYQVSGTNGTAQMTLKASAVGFVNSYTSSATGTVQAVTRLAVSTAFMNNDNQNTSLCAASCFAVTAGATTVPFFTLNQPRSVTVAYHGDRAFPRPFVYADVQITGAPASVQQYRLEVTHNGVDLPFTNGETVLYFGGTPTPGTTYRLGGQLDLSSYATGLVPVRVVVTAQYASGALDVGTADVQVLVVNTQSSSIAKGWAVAGVQQLLPQADNSAVVVDGGGSAWRFGADGSGGYVSPDGDFTTVVHTSSGWERSAPDGSKIWFSAVGLEDSVTDRNGLSTKFEYDGAQRLVRIYDPMLTRSVGAAHAATALSYGSYGLSSIQEPAPQSGNGRVTYFRVDASRNLRAVINPTNDSTSYSYDSSGRLSGTTDVTGATTTYLYDPTWKLAQIVGPPIPIDAGNGTTTSQQLTTRYGAWQINTVPMSPTASAPYTLLSVTNPAGSVTDPMNRTLSFRVDRFGEPVSVTDPVNNTTIVQRIGVLPTVITHADSSVDSLVYSGPNVVATKPAAGSWTYYRYGPFAEVDSAWGAAARATRYFINASNGNIDSLYTAGTTSVPDVTRFTYDTFGRVTSEADPLGHTVMRHYDPVFGNADSTLAPGGRWIRVTFDAFGRDSLICAPGQPARTTAYDLLNRPLSSWDGVNAQPTQYGYSSGLQTSVRNPKGEVVDSSVFNAVGWRVKSYDGTGSGASMSYRYDKAGRLTGVTNRRGQIIALQYDNVDRLVSRRFGAHVDTMTYNATGTLATASNPAQIDTAFANVAIPSDSVVTRVGGMVFHLGHTDFDGFGVVNHTTLRPDGDLGRDYSYLSDSRTGMLAQLKTPDGDSLYFDFDDDGSLIQTNYGHAVLHTAPTQIHTTFEDSFSFYGTYNAGNAAALADVLRRSYRYDSLGRVAAVSRLAAAGSTTVLEDIFAYDSLGRLVADSLRTEPGGQWPESPGAMVDSANGWQYVSPSGTTQERFAYSYDPAGNRTSQGASYGAGDQILAFTSPNGSYTFEHDLDGNITRKLNTVTGDDRHYYWGPTNLLDSIVVTSTSGASHRVGFQYDAANEPVLRTTDGVLDRIYVWDNGQLVEERDPRNGPGYSARAAYAYDNVDHPVAGYVYNTPEYLHSDALGNIIARFTANQNVNQQIDYDPWGLAQIAGDSVSTVMWKGLHREDGAAAGAGGLYYMRARWYDPEIGRFLSADPAGAAGGLNPYIFAGDDPINGSDPTGLGDCYDVYELTSYPDGTVVRTHLRYSGDCNPEPSGPDNGRRPIGDGPGGGGREGRIAAIKRAVCKALPSGRTEGVGASVGGFVVDAGTLEHVINYNSGESSVFLTAGIGGGWAGAAGVNAFTGFIWGLGNTNDGYKKGAVAMNGSIRIFTGSVSHSANGTIADGTPGFTPNENGGVTTVTLGAGYSPVGPVTGYVIYSTSKEILHSRIGPMTGTDVVMIAARRIACR